MVFHLTPQPPLHNYGEGGFWESKIRNVDDRKRVYYRTELKARRRDLRQKSTKAEKLLWESLRNGKLGVKFRRQYSVNGYVIDFYCPEKRFGVELLGSVHKIESNKKYDCYRRRYLESFGINLLEVWNAEVDSDTEKVVEKIREIMGTGKGV